MSNNIVCVYLIENKVNGKLYVGQTSNYISRKAEHRYCLKNKKHANSELQEDFNKYGMENFRFKILEHCCKSNLVEKETEWIIRFGGMESKMLYNRCDSTGHNVDYIRNQSVATKDAWVSGRRTMTDDLNYKLLKSRKQVPLTEEHK